MTFLHCEFEIKNLKPFRRYVIIKQIRMFGGRKRIPLSGNENTFVHIIVESNLFTDLIISYKKLVFQFTTVL